MGRVAVGRWSDGLHVLVDWGWHRVRHDRGVSHGTSTRRGDGVGSLAAVAPMGQLMVVKAAGQLSLLQVSGNMLVGHLLETGLK